jgi:shikimate dehydrogenase
VDETAKQIGAVNTVLNQDEVLSGYNSDCLGAVSALLEKTQLKEKSVWLIGAGGTARAIGHGILAEGGKLAILNRTKETGERLAGDLGVEFKPLSETTHLNCHALINTTPVGMTPHIDVSPVSTKYLEKGMIVMDVVYNPLKTKLLREAEAAGCITIDGAAMFVYQGAFQFELWTGHAPPIPVMKHAVLGALGEKEA